MNGQAKEDVDRFQYLRYVAENQSTISGGGWWNRGISLRSEQVSHCRRCCSLQTAEADRYPKEELLHLSRYPNDALFR